MKGSASMTVPLDDLLAGENSELGGWLVRLAQDIPDPPGDHGDVFVVVTVTAQWARHRLPPPDAGQAPDGKGRG